MNRYVGILDYGIGNVRSVHNMLWKIGSKPLLVKHPEDLKRVNKLILPGVGSFDSAMVNLEKLGFIDSLVDYAKNNYLLGICLGMQVLGTHSQEGNKRGLNLIPGKIIKFSNLTLPVPHVGWNYVDYKDNVLNISNMPKNRYYFVHSYYYKPDDSNHEMAATNYGINFSSAISNGENIFGTQFHPEKSHHFGKALLTKFIGLPC